MSYTDPAPFDQLKLTAQGMLESLEVLKAHPEGAKAFEAWIKDVDFSERYGTRYKDLPVDQNVPEALVLLTDSFGVFGGTGKLYVESGYATYVWNDGAWVNEDDVEEEDEG